MQLLPAIRRNAGTGDGINVVIIDKDGFRELSKETKNTVEVSLLSIRKLGSILTSNNFWERGPLAWNSYRYYRSDTRPQQE